jgi:preprotein translocase subunit SecE
MAAMTETTTTPSASQAEQEIRVGYFEGASQELRRVVWPTREELVRMTTVVVITVAVIAAFIGGVDALLTWSTRPLYGS